MEVGDPRWGNLLRWGNSPVHIISPFKLITFFKYVIGGVIHHLLPLLSGASLLHVNRP